MRDIIQRIKNIEGEIKHQNNEKQVREKIANRSIKMGGADDELKETIKILQLQQWRLAEAIGMNESAFSRKLRHDVDDKTRAKIYQVLDALTETQT